MKPFFLTTSLFFFLLIFPPARTLAQDGKLPPGPSLPADQEVSPSEGFLTLEAKTSPGKNPSEVRFLVVGSEKIKYTSFGNTLILGIPPTPGAQITVFAISLVDGKLSDFSQCNITVKGARPPPDQPPGPGPKPPPDQPPQPPPSTFGKLFVSIVEDPQVRTPALATLLGSQTLRQSLQASGHSFHLFDSRDPRVAQLRLNQAFTQLPALILQDKSGRVVPSGKALPIPPTEQEFLALIKQVSGQ